MPLKSDQPYKTVQLSVQDLSSGHALEQNNYFPYTNR